ncbi:MAG: copper amine oxidase N-terminal domain-containing protein [Clostridiales bacterium]|nr:copper amine oxidase N-terminal domain-containing protein [Clostridiales bacterium]
MKKLTSILLVITLMLGLTSVFASAEEIDYSCYKCLWSSNDGAVVDITSVNSNTASFVFRKGQFDIEINNASVSGNKVYAAYDEDWDTESIGTVRMKGEITLTLCDNGIWYDWTSQQIQSQTVTSVFGDFLTNPYFRYRTISESNASVIFNGTKMEFEQNPIMINDRLMIPMRAMFETLGKTVTWDGERLSVTASDNNKEIYIRITYPYMRVLDINIPENTKTVELDVAPVLYRGNTMVPVRAVSEAFGAEVTWDGNTNTVYIQAD